MDQLIRFRCECGKKLKATRDIIGRKVRCTQCVRTHRVPESDRLTPKKPQPATKTPTSTKPKLKQPAVKSTPAKQAPVEIESKQQDADLSKPKKPSRTKPKTATGSKSKSRKPKSSVEATKKSKLIIADEMAAKEPSLLPTNDDSDSRFKLDPKFDPAPSDQPLDPESNFEFDIDTPDVETEPASPEPHFNRPSFRRSTGNSKLLLIITAATAGLLLLAAIVWLAFGDSAYPQEFSERPEVRNYVNKIAEFRKSQRTLKIVSEAYVKSKSPTAQEREQIEAFNRSIEPLANEQDKLDEALELFQASEHEKARTALIAATQTLDQKIPELQAKAKDFSSKLR